MPRLPHGKTITARALRDAQLGTLRQAAGNAVAFAAIAPPDLQDFDGIVKLLLVGCCQDWSVAIAARYKGYRYPIEVIGHAVWLYHRFALSLRDVEELMVARGVVVTYGRHTAPGGGIT